MRKGQVFVRDQMAGIIIENETGYNFTYSQEYLNSNHPTPVSLTLPLGQKDYHSNVLFSFFDGLIPEGWMLRIAERNWKIILLCPQLAIGHDPVHAYLQIDE